MGLGISRIIKSVALSVLFILFLFSVNTLVTINAFDATVLNREFAISLLEKHKIHDALYNNLLPALISSGGNESGQLLPEIISQASFRQAVNNFVSDLLSFLKNPEAGQAELVIPKSAIIQETRVSAADIAGQSNLLNARNAVQLMLSLKPILLACSLLLLVLIAVVPKTLPEKIRKIGHALLAAGFSGIFAFLSFQYIIPSVPLAPLSQVDESVRESVLGIFSDTMGGMASSVLQQSIPLLATGFFAILLGYAIGLAMRKES